MIAFRHCDSRFPFLWEDATQPASRWHGPGEGPAQYLTDTPLGAWAEFLRHEEITDPADLDGVSRAIWAVRIEDDGYVEPNLDEATALGGMSTYPACQLEAARLRDAGAKALKARSAALRPGSAGGWRVDNALVEADPADGYVMVLFGRRPDLSGWPVVENGRPPERVLPHVRHF